jgi:hypothetical protein
VRRRSPFFLRYASVCKGCGRALAVGAVAHRRAKGEGVRCALCGPFPLVTEGMAVTVLPPGPAEGATDPRRPIGSRWSARRVRLVRGRRRPP